MKTQRPVIYFHGIRTGRYLPVWPAFIVGDDPTSLTFSVAVDNPAFAEEKLSAEGEESPGRRRGS